jgi:hypothetical protein
MNREGGGFGGREGGREVGDGGEGGGREGGEGRERDPPRRQVDGLKARRGGPGESAVSESI